MAYHCPVCDGKTGVMDTRAEVRRRKCQSCNHLFYTEEIEYAVPTGKKNPFTLKKLENDVKRQSTLDFL